MVAPLAFFLKIISSSNSCDLREKSPIQFSIKSKKKSRVIPCKEGT